MIKKFLKIFRFVFPGIIFYIVLESFFKSFGFSIEAIFLLFAVPIFSAFLITKYQPLTVIVTTLFSLGSVLFLLTIGQTSLQKYYTIFISILFILVLVGVHHFFIKREKELNEEKIKLIDSGFNLNQTIVMFTAFLITSGSYGIYTTFEEIQTWHMMLFIFISIFLLTFYLTKINFIKSKELELHLDFYKNRTFKFYSFLMALIILELSWAATFLPINHLTFGALILSVYFSFWEIIKKYLRNELTRKKFLKYITFFVLSSLIIIATSELSIN